MLEEDFFNLLIDNDFEMHFNLGYIMSEYYWPETNSTKKVVIARWYIRETAHNSKEYFVHRININDNYRDALECKRLQTVLLINNVKIPLGQTKMV